MKYAQFDKATLKAMRTEMQDVLDRYGSSANINFTVGNIRFSMADCEIKVKAVIKGAQTRTNKILEAKIASLKLVTKNKRGESLVDYKPRNTKYPFIYKGVDGKSYKTSELAVKIRFAA